MKYTKRLMPNTIVILGIVMEISSNNKMFIWMDSKFRSFVKRESMNQHSERLFYASLLYGNFYKDYAKVNHAALPAKVQR